MNCEQCLSLLSAALDDELSATERAWLERHLTECESCQNEWISIRQLDVTLATALPSPPADVAIERLLSSLLLVADTHAGVRPDGVTELADIVKPVSLDRRERTFTIHRSGRSLAWGPIWLIGTVLAVIFCVFVQVPNAAPFVAEITLTTGAVEVLRPDLNVWQPVNCSTCVPIAMNARVRTRDNSLCEIRTRSDALVRLNCETELIVRRPGQIELINGEFWCRAPATNTVEISTMQKETNSEMSCFTCPSSSETQWRASPETGFCCQAVSPVPIEVIIERPNEGCVVKPGESYVFTSGHVPESAGRSDRFNAVNWQLPLLLLRNPNDNELQQRLTQILATIGRSKASYLPARQIRQLGPAGTVPLLAFVRSSEDPQQAESRYNAMEIVADLAPSSCFPELNSLLSHNDPNVRQLAQRALDRLQSAGGQEADH